MALANELVNRFSRSLAEAGYSARILRREGERTALTPSVGELLILVDVDSVLEWLDLHEKVADVCRHNLSEHTIFSMAPVRLGRAVASYAVKVITDVFPEPDVREWSEVSFTYEALGEIVRSGISGLCEMSGVLSSLQTDQLHAAEQAALDHAATRAREAYEELENLLAEHDDDRVLAEVSATYAGFAESIEREAAEVGEAGRTNRSFAASMLKGLNGETNETWLAVHLMLVACAEWDVEPTDGWSRLGLDDDSEPVDDGPADRTS